MTRTAGLLVLGAIIGILALSALLALYGAVQADRVPATDEPHDYRTED